jgi:hypothetical protein
VRVKFIADADLRDAIVRGVRKREPSIDFLSATEGGTRGLADPDVLRIAAASGRVLVSHDRKTMIGHFYRFAAMHDSPGLLIVSQDLPTGIAIERLLQSWATLDAARFLNTVRYLSVTAAG